MDVDDCVDLGHSCSSGQTLVCTGVCECDPGGGGTGGSGGSGGSGAGGFSNEIAGTYQERYNCKWSDGTCADVDVLITMTVAGPDQDGNYTIDDLGSNAEGTGTRPDATHLVWQSSDPDFPGFSEAGTWEFDFSNSPTTFIKASTFQQPDSELGTRTGECTGSGVMGAGDPGPPPPLPCTPP